MRYRRVPHRIVAEPLADAWIWHTARGEPMVGAPGDYRVVDPETGAEWSVTASALDLGYRRIDGDVYESLGEVHARQVAEAEPSQLVVSIEGPESATPGDWILVDDEGRSWVVRNDWFREHYCAVD